jgi:hypothetical protein
MFEPGAELDRLVCEKLGIKPRPVILAEPPYEGISWPPLSTDTGLAMTKIMDSGHWLSYWALARLKDGWAIVSIADHCNVTRGHPTAAMALCLAAMKHEI